MPSSQCRSTSWSDVALEDDPPHLERTGGARDAEGQVDVLLDERISHTPPVDIPDDFSELLDDDRREAEGRLVRCTAAWVLP